MYNYQTALFLLLTLSSLPAVPVENANGELDVISTTVFEEDEYVDTSGTFRYAHYRNSIALHPVALVRIPFSVVMIELDYLRFLNNGFALQVRGIYKEFTGNTIYNNFFPEGLQKEISLETGIRRNFFIVKREIQRWGLYPELAMAAGTMTFDHTDPFFRISMGIGIVYQWKRAPLCFDIQSGFVFHKDQEFFYPNPNFALGFTF